MMYVIALYIMLKAHLKQKDKSGRMYIFHPLYVSFKLKGYNAKIVGLLHDVVEDSDYTIDDLKKYFNKDIIEAISIITKNKNEKYEDYLKKIKSNKLARLVKIEDLKHNSDLSRLKNITIEDKQRELKYKKALIYLEYR